MVKYELGQIVKAIAGREIGQYFLIVQLDEKYVYLADGNSRRLEAPKKKKRKHIQITHAVAAEIAEKLSKDDKLSNAEVRRSLKDFLKL